LLGNVFEMRFTENKNTRGFYKAKKRGFEFTISSSGNAYYVVAVGQKKDIRLNTLWIKLTFETFEKAEEFCEKFDWKQHPCIGDDVNVA
jgi:hypothetical protein